MRCLVSVLVFYYCSRYREITAHSRAATCSETTSPEGRSTLGWPCPYQGPSLLLLAGGSQRSAACPRRLETALARPHAVTRPTQAVSPLGILRVLVYLHPAATLLYVRARVCVCCAPRCFRTHLLLRAAQLQRCRCALERLSYTTPNHGKNPRIFDYQRNPR